MSETTESKSLYEIAGPDFFIHLVDAFYDGIETDQVLLPLYPEGSETTGARERLALFLIQYWGGPDTYMQERGHPRLRMRHAPFVIGALERDHWLMHMASDVSRARHHRTCELHGQCCRGNAQRLVSRDANQGQGHAWQWPPLPPR